MFIPLLFLGALLSLLYLNQTSDVAATGYDIADLQAQQRMLDMQNQQLRLQIAQLESLDRVDREATTRLHMGPPRHVMYISTPIVAIPTPTPVAAPSKTNSASPATMAWHRVVGEISYLAGTGPALPTPSPTETGGG